MKDLITKILNEEITRKLTSGIIGLFKLLYSKRKEIKTKKAVIEFFENRLPAIGKSSKDAEMFYYLYTLNYRENGDFENIPPDEFINEKNFPALKVTNVSAGKYAYAKIPFEGSNLRGYWDKDRNGVEQYVITSYGWYPILVFKNDKWYSVSDKYSSSTSKQYSNAVRGGIYGTTQLRSKDLKNLIYGKNENEIKKSRIVDFIEEYANKLKSKSFHGFYDLTINDLRQKLSFDCDITDIENIDDKIYISANVKLKQKYKGTELNESQKTDIKKYFAFLIFEKTTILNPEDVEINVNYVDL